MPTTSRLRVLLAGTAVLALPFLALTSPGTAQAVAVSSEEPCPLLPPPCEQPTESATPEPTESAEPTPIATPTPTATRSATPAPRRTSSSPRPRSTYTAPSGSVESPVTGTIEIGGVARPSESATPAPETEESSSSGSGSLTRLLVLVIGAAVLLGVSGATGLYLTRHHHD